MSTGAEDDEEVGGAGFEAGKWFGAGEDGGEAEEGVVGESEEGEAEDEDGALVGG